ncbi:MAG: NAD(P)H-dependent oxidoreductase [Burkholderiales bacterium]|nr:NAD(P)H-dependent oxidoreductase [Burkholderiales bacterium]
MRDQLLDALRRRHACHRFQTGREVSAEDLDYVLEAGRLAPSSFGLEQWRFVVLTREADKRALQAVCFDQPQVGEAACDVVILAKLAELHPDHPYVRRLLARECPPQGLEQALANYRAFHAATDVAAWSITQCHIAAAHMMIAAAAIGIDSCPIGGFDPQAVAQLLGLPPGQYAVALILALGYCAEPAGERQRLPLAELVEYR